MFGALIATGYLHEIFFPFIESSPFVIANCVDDDHSTLVGVVSVDTDVKNGLTFVVKKEHRDKGGKLTEMIAPAIKLFNSEERNRLMTAASWLFRAYVSTRPVDQALESAIAIEVLLGDRETSDRIGLSKLMANRSAYALGASHKERSDLIDLFLKFYKVRSEIVHSGRFKVSEEDRRTVGRGRELAARLLHHEITVS